MQAQAHKTSEAAIGTLSWQDWQGRESRDPGMGNVLEIWGKSYSAGIILFYLTGGLHDLTVTQL